MPYLVQGISIHLPTEPVVYQGATYVSLREMTVELGGTVDLTGTSNSAAVTITPGRRTRRLGVWIARCRATARASR